MVMIVSNLSREFDSFSRRRRRHRRRHRGCITPYTNTVAEERERKTGFQLMYFIFRIFHTSN